MGAGPGEGRGRRATIGAGADDIGADACATAVAGTDVGPGHRVGPAHGLGARVASGPRAEPVPGLGAQVVSGDAAKASSVAATAPGLGGGPKAIRGAAAGLGPDSGARLAAGATAGTGRVPADSAGGGRQAGEVDEIDTTVWRHRGTPLVGAAAPGPLTGLAVAVKDLYAVAGFTVGAGIPAYAREQPAAAEHAVAVARLLAAGAEVTGIAQTDEFAYSLTGSNGRHGMPVNPVALHHIPGGSTSGPAVAVARGEVDIGLGTDTAGSIRVPAAYQGLWGIRTTHGRLDTTGLLPLAQSFDTIGWLTADGETLAAVAECLLGADPAVPDVGAAAGPAGCADTGCVVGTADAGGSVCAADTGGLVGTTDTGGLVGASDTGGLVGTADTRGPVCTADTGGPVGAAAGTARFAVDYALCDSADPAIAAAVRSVADALRAEPVDLRPPGTWLAAFRTVQAYEAWANHGEWVAAHPGELEPDVAQRFAFAATVTAGEAAAARAELAAAADRIRTTLGNRVLVLPAAATPPPLRTADAEIRESTRARTLRLTCLASIAGLPAVTLPLGRDEGGPSGLCLVGAPGTDRSLIRLALSTAAVAVEGSPHSEDRV